MARWISIFPLHGSGRFVVLTDVSQELFVQIRNGSEYASGDDVALDLAEPQLDLIQPRRVGRSEVQVNLGMHRQEIRDRPALVSREVVGDHMDLFAAGLIDHNVCEERGELGRGVPRSCFAEHLPGLGVEGGIQRQGAVAKVLKAVPFCASRGQRQNRIFAIQGLDGGLFIYAEHRGMCRRVQIQPNNVGGLLLKIRIVRGHVALDAMRLESVLTPHPCHHHVADVQMRSEFARAPVRCPTGRRTPGGLENPCFQFRGEHGGDLSPMSAVESRDALLGKSFAPAGYKTPAAVDALGHFIPRVASASSKISRARRASSARSVRLLARRVSSMSSEFDSVMASLMDAITAYK